MERHQIFALILGLSVVNGMFSPYLDLTIALAPIWVPSWLPDNPSLLFYFASLLTATTTLLLSGVPAGLAEGAVPGLRNSNTSLWIWAGAAFVLTIPGILRLVYLIAA
jgi:heme/copper-type cytochrome/quinol oxidase subunit 3